MADKIEKTDDEWRAELTAEQYAVCRQKGTEPAFNGKYCDTKDAGTRGAVARRSRTTRPPMRM